MEFRLAKRTLQSTEEKITFKQIQESAKDQEKIFYFSNENSHKDLLKIVDYFSKLGRSVYFREVKYGLDEKEYIYELHIV